MKRGLLNSPTLSWICVFLLLVLSNFDLCILKVSYYMHISYFVYYIFIYFLPHWVFFAIHELSLVVVNESWSSLWNTDFSLWWLLLQSMGSRHADFSSCCMWAQLLWGLWGLPERGSNPCPLHWEVNSELVHHQGSPVYKFRILLSSWSVERFIILRCPSLLLTMPLASMSVVSVNSVNMPTFCALLFALVYVYSFTFYLSLVLI